MSKVSDEQVAELAKAFHDGPLMADDHEFVTDSGQGRWCLQVAEFFIERLSALEAVSSINEAEPVAWQPRYTQDVIDHHKAQDPSVWEYAMTVYQTEAEARGYGYGGHEVRPLFAPPAPISKGVTAPISLDGFGPRIRQALAERNTTLRDLATAIGVDKASASRACQGKSVSMEHFVLLWNWLHEPSSCLSHTAGEIE